MSEPEEGCLHIKSGAHANDLKISLDGEDLTGALAIRSIKIKGGEFITARLETYVLGQIDVKARPKISTKALACLAKHNGFALVPLDDDPDYWHWRKLSSPPHEAGVYQLWVGGGDPVISRPYDPDLARKQRGDPGLAHVVDTWTFGWEFIVDSGATHWRPLPEGPEE